MAVTVLPVLGDPEGRAVGRLPGMIRATVCLSVHRGHGMAGGKDDREEDVFRGAGDVA